VSLREGPTGHSRDTNRQDRQDHTPSDQVFVCVVCVVCVFRVCMHHRVCVRRPGPGRGVDVVRARCAHTRLFRADNTDNTAKCLVRGGVLLSVLSVPSPPGAQWGSCGPVGGRTSRRHGDVMGPAEVAQHRPPGGGTDPGRDHTNLAGVGRGRGRIRAVVVPGSSPDTPGVLLRTGRGVTLGIATSRPGPEPPEGRVSSSGACVSLREGPYGHSRDTNRQDRQDHTPSDQVFVCVVCVVCVFRVCMHHRVCVRRPGPGRGVDVVRARCAHTRLFRADNTDNTAKCLVRGGALLSVLSVPSLPGAQWGSCGPVGGRSSWSRRPVDGVARSRPGPHQPRRRRAGPWSYQSCGRVKVDS